VGAVQERVAIGRLRPPRRWSLLGLLPLALWLGAFLLAPLAILLAYSFWHVTPSFAIEQTFSFSNYTALFTEPLAYKSFLLSLRVALFSTVGAVLIAYPFAYFLAKRAGRWQVLLVVAVAVPFLTSYILRAYAWRTLLGENGIINGALQAIHVIDHPIQALLYSPLATGIGLLYLFLPVTILPIYATLERIPDSYLEASANLGATPARTFREVILPLSMPGVLVAAVFTFVFSIGEYIVPSLLGGGKQLLFSETIVLRVNGDLDWPSGAAMSVVLIAITLVLVALVGRRARAAGFF
jgi:ABC-type spermidine/putrescine transport system permease subunit I